MASDSMAGQPYEGLKGFSLSLVYPTVAEARRVFDALGEGGKVSMPIQDVLAEGFGMLVDRFGTPWMVSGAVAKCEVHRWGSWSPWTKWTRNERLQRRGQRQGCGVCVARQYKVARGAWRYRYIATLEDRHQAGLHQPFEAHNTAEFTLEPKVTRRASPGPCMAQCYIAKVIGIFVSMDSISARTSRPVLPT